jgi:hypothetical protein
MFRVACISDLNGTIYGADILMDPHDVTIGENAQSRLARKGNINKYPDKSEIEKPTLARFDVQHSGGKFSMRVKHLRSKSLTDSSNRRNEGNPLLRVLEQHVPQHLHNNKYSSKWNKDYTDNLMNYHI